MYKVIDGKAISKEIKEEVKKEAAALSAAGKKIALAVVQVGDDPASSVYVRNKQRACEYVGIESAAFHLPETAGEPELLDLVASLNEREDINGILIQLPLPSHMDEDKVIAAIAPQKDVDGFHPVNVGKMVIGQPCFLPCTPAGIIELLKRSGIGIAGKNCVILGRSNIVGKPMFHLMLRENATVTVVHSKTEHLKDITNQADILIVAIGKQEFIDASYVKEGAVVIDVGIHRDEDNHLHGDVKFDEVAPKTKAITPVPGGVGPMTIAMLMANCIHAVSL